MRPNILLNALNVLIAVVVITLSFADFAQARDRFRGHDGMRRHHYEQRSYRLHDRRGREALSGVKLENRRWRRPRDHYISGRTAHRGRFETRHHRKYRPDRRDVVREYDAARLTYGGDDFPSRTGGGTYFGGLSAWHDRGNGTYFHSERNAYRYGDDVIDLYRTPRAKIIRVNPRTAGRDCSWEAGVCVIRR